MATADQQDDGWMLLSQVIHTRARLHGLTVEEAERWWRGRLAPGELKVRWLDINKTKIEKDGTLRRVYCSGRLAADFWDLCEINPIFSLAVLKETSTSLQEVEVYIPHLVEDSDEPQPTVDPTVDPRRTGAAGAPFKVGHFVKREAKERLKNGRPCDTQEEFVTGLLDWLATEHPSPPMTRKSVENIIRADWQKAR